MRGAIIDTTRGGSEQSNIAERPTPEHQAGGFSFKLKRLIASGGGVGFSPFAPGTAASAVAAGIYVAVALLTSAWWIIVPIAVAVGIVGVWLGNHARELFGRDDPGPFVLDEFVGMWIAMFGMGGGVPLTWYGVPAAFVLFRIFDIVKPYPANRLDRIPNGWGIMGDDVAAGLYAGIVVRLGWMAIVLVK